MKKNRQKILALSLSLLLLCTALAGCDAKPAAQAQSDLAYTADSAPMESPEMPAANESAGSAEIAIATDSSAVSSVADPSQKIIYNAILQIETTKFDTAVTAVEKLTGDFGGFLERASVDGSTSYQPDGSTRVVDRTASYVLRIPSKQYGAALKQAGTIGNVISSNQSTDNITSQYIDNESRRDSLRVQEERLLTMLEKSVDVESLVALESRLSEVRYEIESIERQLRNWQTAVDYSTIELNLREVEIYTPTASVQRTFGQKISGAFADGMASFARAMQSLTIGIVGALPVLVLLAIVGVAAWFVVRKLVRRHKSAAQPPVKTDETPAAK